MNSSFTVIGLPTGIIRPKDSIADRVIEAARKTCGGFSDGDILVLAETAVATAEGNVIALASITPSARAEELAAQYRICLLYTSPSPRDGLLSRMPSSA